MKTKDTEEWRTITLALEAARRLRRASKEERIEAAARAAELARAVIDGRRNDRDRLIIEAAIRHADEYRRHRTASVIQIRAGSRTMAAIKRSETALGTIGGIICACAEDARKEWEKAGRTLHGPKHSEGPWELPELDEASVYGAAVRCLSDSGSAFPLQPWAFAHYGLDRLRVVYGEIRMQSRLAKRNAEPASAV